MTKKLRFEVFKRDGFQCGYCGKTPPGVVLEVDHINPKSKGGKDEINNYITACFDCNRGKGATHLNVVSPQIADNLLLLREKELQLKEFNKLLVKITKRQQKDIEEISQIYSSHYLIGDGKCWVFSEIFKNGTLKKFLSLLPKQEIVNSLYLAIEKFPVDENNVIKYFCGICWNKIKGTERY